MEKRKHTPEQALAKIQNFCAYQERSHKEVRNKLFEYGLWSNQVDDIISQLITDGFLNEERFAKAFAGGKFRMKKWGRLKIIRELEQRGLTPRCIQTGLNEIDQGDYQVALKQILTKKKEQLADMNDFEMRNKLARYAIGKGFEPDLVWQLVKDIVPKAP
ncbi:MAG: regulatory protein RecX [Cyclobacteriaceae bacterium]